jgi:hypothetical protein
MSACNAFDTEERIDGGIYAELGDRTLQHDRGVQVREGVRRRRVGKVVGRHVDGLEGGDGAFLRGRDPLLEQTHLVRQRRLITDGGGRASEQSGYFRTRLREAEDVIDEEQHVLVLLVAEIFRHRQGGKRDAHAGARRLVHLAVDERDLGFGEVLLIDNAGLGHFVVKVVALARALTHPGEHRVTAVGLRDVVDELHDHDRLADARTAEGADLAALGEGRDQVDDLDAGFENLGIGVLVDQRGRGAMDRVFLREIDRPLAVDGLARDVENTTEHAFANRHGDRSARIENGHTAHEAFGGRHRDRARDTGADVLLHFQGQQLLHACRGELDGQGLIDRRDRILRELHVNDGADDLDDFAGVHVWEFFARQSRELMRMREVVFGFENLSD